MKDAKAPNCYDCKYRGEVPGSCHSSCRHPAVKDSGDFFESLIGVITGRNSQAMQELNIKGTPHGIRSGWFLWPADFDPVWLESCEGFTKKEEAK